MACPKTFTSYPNTATRKEVPFFAANQKADSLWLKDKQTEDAYKFGRRRFTEPVATHGAYGVVDASNYAVDTVGLPQDALPGVGGVGGGGSTGPAIPTILGDFNADFSSDLVPLAVVALPVVTAPAAPATATRAAMLAAIDIAFQEANGFCDGLPFAADFNEDFGSDLAIIGPVYNGGPIYTSAPLPGQRVPDPPAPVLGGDFNLDFSPDLATGVGIVGGIVYEGGPSYVAPAAGAPQPARPLDDYPPPAGSAELHRGGPVYAPKSPTG